MVKNWAPINQKNILKPGFEEKIRLFRIFKKIFLRSDNSLILRLSIATQLSTNLLLYRLINRYRFLSIEQIEK